MPNSKGPELGGIKLDYKINVGDLLAMLVAVVAAASVFFKLEARVDLAEQSIRFNENRINAVALDTRSSMESLKVEIREGFARVERRLLINEGNGSGN